MSSTHEQWDIVSSVGFTALLVAAGRAVESHREDRLVDDPWAERFVEAAKAPSTVPVRPGEQWEIADDQAELRPEVEAFWSLMTSYQGVRSRFFDAVLDAAVARGVDQVVLLAAGLDVRAWRMHWASPVAVFEVDQAGVLEFKDEVVAAHGAQPPADRRPVGVDLRDDWAAGLRGAGFDPARPTVWLAEGLLPFLPAEAQDALLRIIDELSAPGSEIAAEHFADAYHELGSLPAMAAVTKPFGVDPTQLASPDDRVPAERQLNELGWAVSSRPSVEVARTYGRELGTLPNGTPFPSDLITATKR